MGKKPKYGPPLVVVLILGVPLVLLIEGCRLGGRLIKWVLLPRESGKSKDEKSKDESQKGSQKSGKIEVKF